MMMLYSPDFEQKLLCGKWQQGIKAEWRRSGETIRSSPPGLKGFHEFRGTIKWILLENLLVLPHTTRRLANPSAKLHAGSRDPGPIFDEKALQ